MSDPVYSKLPEFGIELRSAAPWVGDRKWVPLSKSKYIRYRFANWDAAGEFVKELKRTQPHLELRVVPFDCYAAP